jgi:long-chain fatty acid transport protein
MPNAYAIYYNPAALGGADGTSLTLDASLLYRIATYNRTPDALSPSNPVLRNDPNYIAANTGKATHTAIAPLPFLAVNTDFGGKLAGLRGGFAVYVPYGGQAEWDKRNDPALIQSQPGAGDGPQRWHDISGQILAVYFTPALAYKLPWGFSLGASFSPVLHVVKDARARNLDGSDDTVNHQNPLKEPQGDLVEGRAFLDAKGVNGAAAFGIYWDPLENHAIRLGFSYTSQPGFGNTVASGTLVQTLGSSPPARPDDPSSQKKVDFVQAYPDIIRFGFSWQATKMWELHSDFQYERWSVMKRQCIVAAGQPCNLNPDGSDPTKGNVILNIPANWRDAIHMRLGAMFSPIEKLKIFAMTGFGTSAVPDATINAATLDGFRIYATAGAYFQASKHIAIGGSYNHVFFLDVDTKGTSALSTFPEPSRSPSADGTYRATAGFFAANIAYTF